MLPYFFQSLSTIAANMFLVTVMHYTAKLLFNFIVETQGMFCVWCYLGCKFNTAINNNELFI